MRVCAHILSAALHKFSLLPFALVPFLFLYSLPSYFRSRCCSRSLREPSLIFSVARVLALFVGVCVCVCVRACVRARVRACVRVRVTRSKIFFI